MSDGHLSDSSDAAPTGASSADREFAQLTMDSIVAFFGTADSKMAHRLGNSHTVIAFHLTDVEPIGCTINLDGEPISAKPEIDNGAEVHVWGTTDTISAVFLGRKHMGLSIAKGEITYKGPVRKFLRAVPMMRKLDVSELKDLASAARDRQNQNGAGRG